MNVPQWIRPWGRKLRAILQPFGDVIIHLRHRTRYTAKELAFKEEVIQRLEALTADTCQETGLIIEILE